jgi:hypothetical protein
MGQAQLDRIDKIFQDLHVYLGTSCESCKRLMLNSIKQAIKRTIPADVLKLKLNPLSLDLVKSGGVPLDYETVREQCITT